MRKLKPPTARPHPQRKIHIHRDLSSCTHVFVRIDRVRHCNTLTVVPTKSSRELRNTSHSHCGGRRVTVSLDRLKSRGCSRGYRSFAAYLINTKPCTCSYHPLWQTGSLPKATNNELQPLAHWGSTVATFDLYMCIIADLSTRAWNILELT